VKPRRAKPQRRHRGIPPELRACDMITDEHRDEWELMGQPSVGTQDYVATLRRINRPAETREERWRAHERVRVRRVST
jgi:hypothetical protein